MDDFKKLVALFLSEIIRSRKTSLRRAAEIAGRVVKSLPILSDEKLILNFLTEVEKDFEEVGSLKQVLHFGYKEYDIRVFEHEIKQYAAQVFEQNMITSVNFLNDASSPNINIQELCLKYPDFCSFLLNFEGKRELIEELKSV